MELFLIGVEHDLHIEPVLVIVDNLPYLSTLHFHIGSIHSLHGSMATSAAWRVTRRIVIFSGAVSREGLSLSNSNFILSVVEVDSTWWPVIACRY